MNMLKCINPFRHTCSRLLGTARMLRDSLNPKDAKGKYIIVEALSERELVRVRGDDVVPFLQGLITNDMYHLQAGQNIATSCMYAMFLNKAGRVLYDTIIYRTPEENTYLIECDKNVSNELRRHLRLYRVRRKIDIESMDKDAQLWAAYNANADDTELIDNTRLTPEVLSVHDPRVRDLGLRVIAPKDANWNDMSKILGKFEEVYVKQASNNYNYRLNRYRCGVGEGVGDLPPGKCFPLEVNCDYMHGVSFHKGCYIGQELTARVHHTGVVRKRLMPLRLTKPISGTGATVQSPSNTNVGVVRNVLQNRALALMRVDQALSSPELTIDGDPCYIEKPSWWPTELPRKASIREGF